MYGGWGELPFLNTALGLVIPGAAVIFGLVALFDGSARIGRQTLVPSRGWGAAAVAFGLFVLLPLGPLAGQGSEPANAPGAPAAPSPQAACRHVSDAEFFIPAAAAASLPAAPAPCPAVQERIDSELARLGYPASWVSSAPWPEKERLARTQVRYKKR